EEKIVTATDPVVSGVPITVLIDGGTASGAELLAGALRDHLNAKLVGMRTTGKWNVQKIADLSNGYALKYTIGVFKTPKGQAPDGVGIDPEVPVDLEPKRVGMAQRTSDANARIAADPQLRAALALLK